MTPAEVALRQISSQEGLIRLHPDKGWDVDPLPGETPEEAAYRAAVDAATSILDAYDGGTAKHSDDVLTVAEAIADRLNVVGEDKKHLTAVAQLHDIGKIMVSPEILNKPGPLNDLEWAKMRRHTVDGEQILAAVPEIAEVGHLVRACHERYDGQGYPDGLAGEQIPLVARIVFAADAFHAMRCDRPYRTGRPVEEALAEMKANAGTQFDPVVVAALCDVHATLAIQRKHGLGMRRSGARSRRLVALLATLAISSSAMAATGAYKDLPLVPDGKGGNVPTATQNPMSALQGPIFGAEHPSAGAGGGEPGSAKANGRAGSSSSSGIDGERGTPSPRAGGNPDPRGVAHGVNGTAPGQAVRPAKKVTPPKAERPTPPAAKPPKANPRARPPQAGPKVKTPKVPNVPTPNPNANPNATIPRGPSQKAPPGKAPDAPNPQR